MANKKWNMEVDVVQTEGTQTFQVRARTAEEALELFRNGGGEIVESDVEVVALDEIDERYTVNNVYEAE